MKPHYAGEAVTVYVGDCREVMPAALTADSIDAIVCDPPYELEFMGAAWDSTGIAYDGRVWAECMRVLKPGGHLVAFGGARTYHRLACAIEDAGFELRDSIMWIHGQGYPKGVNVGKAIGRAAGDGTAAAGAWAGWNTALKPAHEPIVIARKPFAGTVAGNVGSYGTGALNIGACRIAPTGESCPRTGEASQERRYADRRSTDFAPLPGPRGGAPEGRWPTNLVFSHLPECDLDVCAPECAVVELDRQSGQLTSGANPTRRTADKFRDTYGAFAGQQQCTPARGTDTGGASRFFPVFRYQSKAGKGERPAVEGVTHPTVKPLALMRWLVRLVAPAGAVVLDQFLGSGTTAEACAHEGIRCIGIERETRYLPLIMARLGRPVPQQAFPIDTLTGDVHA